jgi:hypothetical protein
MLLDLGTLDPGNESVNCGDHVFLNGKDEQIGPGLLLISISAFPIPVGMISTTFMTNNLFEAECAQFWR